jgi:hypothetical protein
MNYLRDSDKKLLVTYQNTGDIKIAKTMSIFSTLGEYKSIDGYKYYESRDTEYVYYIPNSCRYGGIFIDKNKKILFNSRYFNFFPSHLKNFLQYILPFLNELDLDSSRYIDKNIIAITKWFNTYGHYKDEIFNLYNFSEKINTITSDEYTCLVDFFTESNINYSMDNYQLLNNYLFENNIINANNSILKM